MGTWGIGLYEDDFALDLRNSLALVAKIPANGDRLLEILLTQYGGAVENNPDNARNFWLIVADQFERKGLFSAQVFDNARSIIESGVDLEYWMSQGVSTREFSKRKKELESLLTRIDSPRPLRKRAISKKPPAIAVSPGQIYVFPTMGYQACNSWYPTWEKEGFKPNGWGAFLVVDCGRAFDWLPWCALCSLAVPSDHPSNFEEAINSATLINGHFGAPAVRCIPTASHLKRLQAVLIGNVLLNPPKANSIVADNPSVESAIGMGWSICSVIFGYSPKKPLGPNIGDLIGG